MDPLQPEKDRLAAFGQTYVSAASKSDMTKTEILADAHAVAEEWGKQGKPTDARFDANFGSIEEKVTLSGAFDFFIKHNSTKQNEMPLTEYRKWNNSRKLWINNFINDQGDLAIEGIFVHERGIGISHQTVRFWRRDRQRVRSRNPADPDQLNACMLEVTMKSRRRIYEH